MESVSLDPKEIQQFSKDSARWWDEEGPFAPLHRLNPTRLSYLKAQICAHFSLDEAALSPLKGLKILDVGCGGGLACEPMARMGGNVTGIDADKQAIAVAQGHAKTSGLKITYKATTSDQLKGSYDVVLALEIIEHVTDIQAFVNSCAKLLKPGGIIIFSTLNRTAKSFALGIVAAEYILRWVPQGTHSWKKFVKPSELARATRNAELTPQDVTGLIYNPVTSEFSLSERDIDVNYFMSALKS
jgi:2-polyprenyl-6-hydroxyphenyl methylase/3-demethylubiquinone-9 3-methyltransferase